MIGNEIPTEVDAVFRHFRVCEFTTLSRDGTPVTWPLVARFRPERMQFLLTASIGFPQKAFNIRREPRVALLFSDPTGSGLSDPPAVLVQGVAEAPDRVVTSVEGLEAYWRDSVFRRQPFSKTFSALPYLRRLMDWYYMRLLILVTPRAIRWWPAGDFRQPARILEVPGEG